MADPAPAPLPASVPEQLLAAAVVEQPPPETRPLLPARTLPPLRYVYNGHDYGEITCTAGPFTAIPPDHDWETIRTVLQKAALAQKWMLSTRSSGTEKIRLLCQPGTEYRVVPSEKQPGEDGHRPAKQRRTNVCDAVIVLRRSKRVDTEGNTIFTSWRITKATNTHRCPEIHDRPMLVPNRLTKQQAPLHGVMDRIMRIARRGPDEYLAAHDLLTNALASLDAAFNLKQLAGHAPGPSPHPPLPVPKPTRKPEADGAPTESENENESAANSLVQMRRGDAEAAGDHGNAGDEDAGGDREGDVPRRRGAKRARGGKALRKADEPADIPNPNPNPAPPLPPTGEAPDPSSA